MFWHKPCLIKKSRLIIYMSMVINIAHDHEINKT